MLFVCCCLHTFTQKSAFIPISAQLNSLKRLLPSIGTALLIPRETTWNRNIYAIEKK